MPSSLQNFKSIKVKTKITMSLEDCTVQLYIRLKLFPLGSGGYCHLGGGRGNQ